MERRGRRGWWPVAGPVVLPVVLLVLIVLVAGVMGYRFVGPRLTGPDDAAVPAPAAEPSPAGITAGPETLHDLAYGSASPAQKLDLYLPARTGTAVPLVVNIHGGAYRFGDKAEEAYNVEQLVAGGFAVASLNYRLSGEAAFPAGVQDVKGAVRWLRGHADRYGLDPGRFAAWGSSAGGHLAALIGVTGGQETEFDDPALGFTDRSSAVQAVVTWYAPSDFLRMDPQNADPGGCPGTAMTHAEARSPESLWLGGAIGDREDLAKAASTVQRLRAADPDRVPPFYLVHGSADCSVPRGQSVELAAALKDSGVPVQYHEVPGAGHADPAIPAAQLAPSVVWVQQVLRSL